MIDEEVRKVIESSYKRAQEILESHLEKLHAMAGALIKYETINDDQIRDIMAGRDPQPPADWDSSVSNPPPRRGPEGDAGSSLGSPAGQH